MLTKRIYVCENSIECIFTGIYDAWASNYGHDNNRIQVEESNNEPETMELFSEYIHVKTDNEKAIKVANSIRTKISEEAFHMVCSAAWSSSSKKGDIIYRFLILGFSMGSKVVNHMGDQNVMMIFELQRNVTYEVHHFLGFLRFIESDGNILLAKIKPQNDVLRLIAPHFSDRLSNENFIIYDEKRKSAIVHRSGYSWIYTLADHLDINKFEEYSEKEQEFTSLWQTFFDTIAIEERKNYKLQRNNAPLRFRNNMTEFNN
ncbi:MAG: hypothetical protein K0R92_135 [Lachnospiraceae bacterium]|jgi:probable DNA metabolism protein|nr:hypothetical protein [Lachnospiraceae bacterium]